MEDLEEFFEDWEKHYSQQAEIKDIDVIKFEGE